MKFLELLNEIDLKCKSVNEFVQMVNSSFAGKELIYKSSCGDAVINFEFISEDTFQVNGAYNINNFEV